MNPSVKLIIFRLKEEQYGMDLQHVRSIEFLHDVVPVSKPYYSLKDKVEWKGKVVPVMDLEETLLGEKAMGKEENKILIVEEGDKQIGLLVNEPIDIVDIDIESIQALPSRSEIISREKLKGIATIYGKQVILLDLEQMLKKEEEKTKASESITEENA